MKQIVLIFLIISTNSFSQNIKHITWDDILLDRSIEKLHDTLSQSKDEDEKEFMENHLLIREDGYLMDSKYFDSYLTEKIKEKKLGVNMFCDKREFSKIFRYLKINKISFLKATVKKFHLNAKNNYYVFFETMTAVKSKEYGINFSYYNTFALYVYKWNDNFNNGDYELENISLFNP